MKVAQNVLLAAILAALALIAFDLHRLVSTLSPGGATMTFLFGTGEMPHETRAQRNERLKRETDEFAEDMKTRLGIASPTPQALKQRSDRPAR